MTSRIKSRTEQVVQARTHREVPELVRELYDQGLSQDDVAKAIGVHRATLQRWMADWGIPTRDRRAISRADRAPVRL
jgi:DNA invertase Pin-like site-specific DNA recombinase